MMAIKTNIAAAFCILFSNSCADAAQILSDKTSSGHSFIIISGDIEKGDAKKFALELIKTDTDMVVLSSNGGTTLEAIEIGKSIRLKGASTFVFSGHNCSSACGLIWLAGTNKFLQKGAKVGFHATYTDNQGERITSGIGNALVGRYLTLLNLSEKAIAFATMANPDGIVWLTSSNYKSSGIDVELFGDSEDKVGNSNTKPPTVNTMSTRNSEDSNRTEVWKTVAGWTIIKDHTLSGSCAVFSQFERGTAIRIGYKSLDAKSSYLLLGNEAWKSLKESENYDIEIQFDSFGKWDVPTVGQRMSTAVFLRANFSDASFWNEFSQAKSMNIAFKEKIVSSLALSGVPEALKELRKCQDSAIWNQQDPFLQK